MGTASYYLVWTLFGVSFTCINLYLLISSYFLTESRFSLWKLVKMAVQVLFYALGITAIFWIFTDVPHDLEYLVYSILPISSDFYWFVSMYVGMYVLAPVMNKLILALTKRQLACACALALALVSVWPNIFYFSSALNSRRCEYIVVSDDLSVRSLYPSVLSAGWKIPEMVPACSWNISVDSPQPVCDRGTAFHSVWRDQLSGRSDVGV